MTTRDTTATTPEPPQAERRPATSTHHGVNLTDDYAWLRDENWQEVMRDPGKLNPDIRAYLEAENAYCKNALTSTEALQTELFEEMKGRIKPDDSTVPAPDGPYAYFSRFVPNQQYPQVCRTGRDGGDTQILLDGNPLAEGKPYWNLGASSHSPDHNILAYAVDDKGSELYTIRFRNLETGEDLADEIPETGANMAWAADSQTLYYVRLDKNHRPLEVLRHKLGTPHDEDETIYKETDTGFYVGLAKSQSARFIQIVTHDHQTSEVHLLDAHAAAPTLKCVNARVTGHEYSVEDHGDTLIILTNTGGGEDFKIMSAPISAPQKANWTDRVPHEQGRLILDVVVYKQFMARLERADGLPRIVITQMDTNGEHTIAFDEEAYSLGLASGYEYDTTKVRFTYSSMTTQSEVYDYDMATRERTLRKRQEVPSGHNPNDYVTRRLQATAPDGEQVPITLLYRATTPIDGTAPLFLYGYGAYGISMPASFSTGRLSLVDRGFIFAIAHIRGGKEKGYRWYKNGKRAKKTNTFTDFIAAAHHLIDQNYTRKGNIIANGGSAGGMLMGAIANMEPELFLGIIADVPFVDVLNTMLDKTLPLTPPEWPEWGNPIESPDEFKAIQAYSPYDNVRTLNYPHILANAGLTDPRVTYWEPAKWIARLRTLNTSQNLILLRTNMDAGHAGASGRFEALKETAINYAFAMLITGKAPSPTT